MKRYLVILSLLLAGSVGTLLLGHTWVNSARDQVKITEYVLEGDPTAAGITVTYRTRDRENHLFWETTFAPGSADNAETVFTFSAPGQSSEWWRWTTAVNLFCFSGGYTTYGDFSRLTEEHNTNMPVLAVLSVAEHTQNGEERTEIVRLADYYEYYPMTLDASGHYVFDSVSTVQNGYLREYFRLRVPEEKEIEITVRKDDTGNIDYVQLNETASENDFLSSGGVITDHGIYLFAHSYNAYGELDDRLQCPDGLGIHFIPAQDPENMTEDGFWDLSKIRLFYPTGDAETLSLSTSPDETKLFLYTYEAPKLVLTILDAESGKALQRLELLERDDGSADLNWLEQDSLYFIISGDAFCLVAEDGGRYEKVLTGTIDPKFHFPYYLDCAKVAWDGQRMVIVGATSYCSFYNSYEHSIILGVWDADGLRYCGGYDYSISCDPYARVRLNGYYSSDDPLSIAFTDG